MEWILKKISEEIKTQLYLYNHIKKCYYSRAKEVEKWQKE
jgi:hypothetical protein